MDSTSTPPPRVVATAAAVDMLNRLAQRHGDVLFLQSGGCCDGSAPICIQVSEFAVGSSDVLIGHIGTTPFYIARAHWPIWERSQLILDIEPGSASMFSLEGGTGMHFVSNARRLTDEEWMRVQHAPL